MRSASTAALRPSKRHRTTCARSSSSTTTTKSASGSPRTSPAKRAAMATTRATGPEQSPVDDEFLDLLYRGGELLAAGKVIEAKDFLEQAHKLQPRHEKGQNLHGLTYFK